MSRPSTRLLALARLCENLAAMEPDITHRCHGHIADVDGYTAGTDAPKVSHSNELTGVEAAAESRLYWHRVLADRDAGIKLVAATLHDLLTEGHKILVGSQPDAHKPRCNGTIDPICRNIPIVDGGLCLQCLARGGCPRCQTRPIASNPPRRLESGELGCEACDRRERRTKSA